MIAGLMLAAMGQASQPGADVASFIEQTKRYTAFVTPHCAGEIVEPYRAFNARRDAAFVRSLRGTALEPFYRSAVQQQRAQDQRTVFECFGPPPPPPPPPPPGVAVATPPVPSPRADVIASTQKKPRGAADDLPGYFDKGDSLFTRMVASADQLKKGTR